MAKTFKQLQDNVLEWMADANDTGLMRTLVKQGLDKAQRRILTSDQLDFMLSPPTSLSVVAGQTTYVLPSDCLSLLYLKDPDRGEYLEDVPIKGGLEAQDALEFQPDGVSRYRVVAVEGVSVQPSVADNIDVTTSGGAETLDNYVIIQGLTSSGLWVEESLQIGTSWSSRSTTNMFARVDNIIKVGTTWSRTITVSTSATTLATLTASQTGPGQFQKLELVGAPTTADTLEYRYYKSPIDLVYDNQQPQLPDAYRDVLEYRTLLALQGFTKATPDEMAFWAEEAARLETQLKQNYQQARSMGARNRRILMVPRT